MKKRLLLSLALGLVAGSTFAYNVGDYIYTSDAKYKVVGDNLLSNGNFASNFSGWTQLNGNAVDPECWSVATGAAADGSNAIQSLSNADGNDGTYIGASVAFESSKTYIITMKVNTPASFGSSVTQTSTGYIDVYANADGSFSKTATRFQQVATSTPINSGSWQDVSFAFTDTITGGSTGSIVVALGRLEPGTQVSNIEIREVNKVFDTRIAEDRVAYDKRILALPEFTENKDDLAGMVEQLDACLKANDGSALGLNLDDEVSMTDFLTQMKELENQYLDANSYDLVASKVVSAGTLWSSKIQKGNGNYGDWFCGVSGRWFHNSGDDYVYDYIQSSYPLGAGTLGIHKTLPAGKYMFQIEAKGLTYLAGKDESGNFTKPDYDTPVTNQLYIGTDTLAADTLDHRNYKTYFIIADVPAATDASELNLVAGVVHQATAKGGTFYYRNPVLRYLGTDAKAVVEKFVADNEKATQQNAAKVMIDSANVIVNKAEYPWGKSQLKAGITACTATYDALVATESTTLLDKLDATGAATGAQISVADSLMETMRDMRGYIDAYYTENKPYTNLAAAVADAQSVISDPDNAGASASTRSALQTAIDNANAAIKTFAAQTDSLPGDVDKSAALVEALNEASVNFRATTASLANPTDITIVNPLFQSNRTGWDTSGSESGKGFWQGNSKWKNAEFEGGLGINMWRGYTAYPKNVVRQTVTLTHAGAYEFSCQARAYNENGGRDGDMTSNNHVCYFAKLVNEADSIGAITVHTNRTKVDSLGYGAGTPEYFVIVYNKTTDTPEEVSFGFDATQNSSSNTYQFGGNHIRYMGAFAAYQADVKTALTDSIAEAQKLLTYNKALSADNAYKALNNAVICAQSAIDGTTLAFPLSSSVKAPYAQSYVGYVAPETTSSAKRRVTSAGADAERIAVMVKAMKTLARAKSKFVPVATGIESVNTSNSVRVNVKGVYNIAGQRVGSSVEGLPSGIYIVDGHKVIIK